MYDDSELIVSRLPSTSWADWWSIIISPYYTGLPYFRPLPALLFALERTFFGLEPFWFHLTNTILVGVLGWALYRLLRQSCFRLEPATDLVISLICTAHPVVSSLVYMLSGREALLAGIFLTLAVTQLLQRGFDWWAALYLFCALISRESSVFILPLLLLLILRYQRAESTTQLPSSWCSKLLAIFGIGIVCLAYLGLRQLALAGSASGIVFSGDWRLLPLSYLYALSSILLPSLNLHYEPELAEWLYPERMLALVVALTLLIMTFKESKASARLQLLLLLLAAFSLLPTANIFEQETPMDERHLLAPAVLLTIAVGIAVEGLRLRFQVKAAWVLLPLLLLGAISFSRGAAFKSDDAFIDNWIRSAPERAKVINHLAARALVNGELDSALELADRSVALQPSYLGFLYRGRIKRARGDLAGARADLERSVEVEPREEKTTEQRPLCDLALLEKLAGDLEGAKEYLAAAAKEEPPFWCAELSGPIWQTDPQVRAQSLDRLPIMSREELRNFAEWQQLIGLT